MSVLLVPACLGILQATVLEWVAIPLLQGIIPSKGLKVSLLQYRQLVCHLSPQGTVPSLPQAFTGPAAANSLQSCLTLCDPIGGSPPGSPVPGILQAGTLEWVAISFSNAGK